MFSRANEMECSPAELEAYLDLWNIAEGVSFDDPAEVARAAQFRQLFWAEVARGGRLRQLAIRDLRRELLEWLEEPPRRSLEELMAIAPEDPQMDVSEALVQVLDRERLRLAWAPRLRGELAADDAAMRIGGPSRRSMTASATGLDGHEVAGDGDGQGGRAADALDPRDQVAGQDRRAGHPGQGR